MVDEQKGKALRNLAEEIWRAGGGSAEAFEEAWPELRQELLQALQDPDRLRELRKRPEVYRPDL